MNDLCGVADGSGARLPEGRLPGDVTVQFARLSQRHTHSRVQAVNAGSMALPERFLKLNLTVWCRMRWTPPIHRAPVDAAHRRSVQRRYGEELTAEFCTAFLTAEVGLDNIEPNAAYVKSWLEVLKNDRQLLVLGAAQGQKAADYILGATPEDQPPDEDAVPQPEAVTSVQAERAAAAVHGRGGHAT